MNAFLPLLPQFVGLLVCIRCMVGMWSAWKHRDWEEFARWSIALFVVAAAMSVVDWLDD